MGHIGSAQALRRRALVLCGAFTGNDDHDCRRGSSPAINIPLWTVNSLILAAIKSYKNYKMNINVGYVENVPTLAQPGSALFRYVAKMAAVKYGECPSIHTSRLAHFEYGIRVLEVYSFSPYLNWNVLCTQILASKCGQYGYWNTAPILVVVPLDIHWVWSRASQDWMGVYEARRLNMSLSPACLWNIANFILDSASSI